MFAASHKLFPVYESMVTQVVEPVCIMKKDTRVCNETLFIKFFLKFKLQLNNNEMKSPDGSSEVVCLRVNKLNNACCSERREVMSL